VGFAPPRVVFWRRARAVPNRRLVAIHFLLRYWGEPSNISAPELGLWILATATPLLILGVIDMRRGDTLFGTLGMVFGGLLGLGAGLAFV
jgi:hypothetical protein